jgi:curved DNA-binding protein CbpA
LKENFYQILGVGIKANADEIKSAYKKLARENHPDVNQGSKVHEEKFKIILEAYQTLSDPRKKDLYDVKLFYKHILKPGNPDPIYKDVPKTRRQKEEEEYKKRRPDREAYREYTGPPISKKLNMHSIAITLLVFATAAMGFLWFGEIMNHITAKEHLEQGDYATALEFDNEYGEAYFARFKARKPYTRNQKILLMDLNSAIRYSDEQYAEMYLERAKVYFKLDSIGRSISDFLTAKTINKNCDTAFFALAELNAYYLNQPKVALSYYDSTLQISPNSYDALFGKAYMLYRLKRFQSAIQQFDVCFSNSRTDKRLFFYRGSARLALGDSSNACADLDQSLTMGMEEAKPLVDMYCLKKF